MPKPPPKPTSPAWPLGLVLLASIVAVFYPVCGADFVQWDDGHNIYANADIRRPTARGVAWYWSHEYGHLYIPATYTAWSAVSALSTGQLPPGDRVKLNPSFFHSVNLFAHMLSAALVFFILRCMVRRDWAACAGALLFAIHPVQVESVAWVSGLKDLLAGLFALAAILLYLRAARERQISKLGSQMPNSKSEILKSEISNLKSFASPLACPSYLAATLLFILAMLSKPSAVVAPIIIAIVDLVLLRRPVRRVVLPIGLWFLLCIPIVIIARYVQPASSLAFKPAFWSRPLIALDALAFYARQLVGPIQLCIDYGRTPKWLLGSPQAYFTWLIPAAIAVFAIIVRRRWPFILAGFLIFVAALLPNLGLVSFDFQAYSTTADHYLYLAMLGPALILAAALALLARPTAIAVAATTIILIALGILANFQAQTWEDSESLFEHAIAVNPDSLAGNVNLGVIYADRARFAALEHRNADALAASGRAIELFQRALKRIPDDFHANKNIANMYFTRGSFDQAVRHYQAALNHNPKDEDVQTGLRQAQLMLQKRQSQVR